MQLFHRLLFAPARALALTFQLPKSHIKNLKINNIPTPAIWPLYISSGILVCTSSAEKLPLTLFAGNTKTSRGGDKNIDHVHAFIHF